MNEGPPDITFNELGLARGFNEGTIRDFPALILEPALKWWENWEFAENPGKWKVRAFALGFGAASGIVLSLCQGHQPR